MSTVLFVIGRIQASRYLVAAACAICVVFLASYAFAAVPGAPAIGVTSAGSKQVMVHFKAPVSDGGSPILDYTVTASPGGLTATGTSSPITVSGLTNGQVYTFTVTARNSFGNSSPSAATNNTTPRMYAPTIGSINNLVVFIRFSDQPAFIQSLSYYSNLFNSDSKSLKNFYLENSYGTLTVTSFFPTPEPTSLSTDGFSYKDVHPTAYYQPYDASTNPLGYTTGTQSTLRETELISNALNAVSAQVAASGLNLDSDSDGFIDHITFEVYSSTANPQPGIFFSRATYDTSGAGTLNGLQVGSYTWVAAPQDFVPQYLAATEIHEMGHSFGYPDLRNNGSRYPVGNYDVMSLSTPVHAGAYEKFRFTHWVPSLTDLAPDAYGTYTLDSIASPTSSNSYGYKIQIPNSSEFLVLEYRKASGPFESNLPGSGLCITRVNEAAGMWGNLGGPPFYLYYFRPGGTFASDGPNANSFVCLNAETGRVQFNDVSNPPCFLSDGTSCGISIDAIGSSSGPTITFSITNPATTIVKRVISGYLYNGGSRVSGATVTLSGDVSSSVTTDSLGRYLFVVNSGGSYAITPVKANMTFSPAVSSYAAIAGDQTQNFAGTKITTTISGTVTSSGAPLSGIPVVINCPAGGNYVGSTTTDQAGSYAFTVDAGSTCTVWSSKINYIFVPNSVKFTNITSNQILDFITDIKNINLSGTITHNGTSLSGVILSLSGARTAQIITNGTGTYSFAVTIGDGSVYTVTPTSPAYAFFPINKIYTGLFSGQDQVQNFTGTPNPMLDVTLSGTGGGSVADGIPSGYSCSTNPCPSSPYVPGTAVTLFAAPDSNSLFSKWSANCGLSGNCVVTMDASKGVTVTFDRLQWVRNDTKLPPYYGLMSNAYKDATSGDTIKTQARLFSENLLFDSPIDVMLDGGYDTLYQDNSGYTDVQGVMKINNGKVLVRRVRIVQ